MTDHNAPWPYRLRNNVGCIPLSVSYDEEENCVTLVTTSHTYCLSAGSSNEQHMRELADLLATLLSKGEPCQLNPPTSG
jgi:hypothetical protein